VLGNVMALPASVRDAARALGACVAVTAIAAQACIASAQDAPTSQAAPPPAAAQQDTRASRPAERHVDIDAYDVDGNTKLDENTVASAVYPYLGPQRTREDVENARAALEHAYQEHGYQSVVVEIPPQTVSEGIVKLHVVEAPVGRLRVVGSRYVLPSFIKSAVPSLAPGQVPNFTEAQSELAALNRLPDRTVTPVIKAGEDSGTLDVDLRVKDTLPFHASVELNNDHSANTPPLRVIASASYDDLWQLGNTLSFTYLSAPQDVSKSQVFVGGYSAPIYGTPWLLSLTGYTSNSITNTLGGTGVLGNGYSINGRAILSLPSIGDFSDSVSFGLAYDHFLVNTNFNALECVITNPTSVPPTSSCATDSYFPVSVSYSVSRTGTDWNMDGSLSATFGTRGLGSTPRQFELSRADATTNFVHLNLDYSVMQSYWHDIQAAMHITGQLTDQPLVPTEQFAAGGLSSVRGYLQAEAIGDDGLGDSLEIRSPSAAPYVPYIGSYIDDWRAFVFGDVAEVWLLDPLPSQQSFFRLASTGIGSRLGTLGYITSSFDVAWPLIAGPYTKAYAPVTTFTFKAEF
jgi:hemolysin activation/secretion protein